MQNKTKLRYLIISLTPPIFYPIILKLVTKITEVNSQGSFQNLVYSPSWQKIKNGIGEGILLYIDTTTSQPAIEMVEGKYDDYFFQKIAKQQPEGKIIFDIGSHIGYDALLFANQVGKKGKVVCFEPNMFNRKRLEMNCDKNSKQKKSISIFDLAISDKNGIADFLMTNTVDGWTSSGSFLDTAHTSLEHGLYERELGFKKVKVKTSTLDDFVKKNKLRPNIIKIDVEGAEYQVLSGAQKTLSNYSLTLFIEVHSIHSAIKVGSILEKLSYVYEVLHEDADGRCFIMAKKKSKV